MSEVSVPQNCYEMAYYLLPGYVYNEKEKVIAELSMGRIGAMFFYTIVCLQKEEEPTPEAMNALKVNSGEFDNYNYHIITYPTPPPVDTDISIEDMIAGRQRQVLAPYFSAIIEEKSSQKMRYFILGQSPDGLTTLRTVTIDEEGMTNANLGRGCTVDVNAFITMLQEFLHREN
ncbi:hypothetical protein [Candidatus Uabimicrobium amorphum]|uniref:Uncharacterized protein n=1 Tax=Uabimicrobium amorphum TaxID=2596890 RepID=A0A5S9IVJ8_UABAM|nr:hypothetical protein [Candidatus Uabimicrobium amorphum]BBM87890.1 hypothetical protein UABAM_06305 [Candidatus Uabimicrobium amorphum]